MTSIEGKLNQALDNVAYLERQNAGLRRALRQERVFKAQVELEERIAALPTDAKERLRKAFPDTNLGGLKEAINCEKRGAK
jgi:hypothetical protein